MSRILWFALLPMMPLCALAATPAQSPEQAACEVWQRELTFARSVQQHDAAAFAGHVRRDAIFDANTARPTRGADAIARHWAAIIDGKTVHLSWYPQQVVASADGTLAYSSGTYLLEDPAPAAKPRYTIGQFATVWQRGSDRVWRVAFDGGDSGRPVGNADAAAFRARRRERCPGAVGAGLPTILHR
ncbi:YybH family protein [Rhodanobacter umsongensis]|uniref:YybH family protein n=1 Tax=Rhodanobacter umsongensis TaxID=633153 RepID=A0ABW0JGW7_9GAMM